MRPIGKTSERFVHRSIFMAQLSAVSGSALSGQLSPTADFSLVFLFKDVGGVKVERRSGPLVGPPKLRVATIADCQLGQPAVHNQVDDYCAAKNAVGDQV